MALASEDGRRRASSASILSYEEVDADVEYGVDNAVPATKKIEKGTQSVR